MQKKQTNKRPKTANVQHGIVEKIRQSRNIMAKIDAAELTPAERPAPAPQNKAVHQRNEIPKFDLAEQIMAEHRSNTSTRRKSPNSKKQLTPKQPETQFVNSRLLSICSLSRDQDSIIREIVANDIIKLTQLNATIN